MISFLSEFSNSKLIIGWEVVVSGVVGVGFGSLVPGVTRRVTIQSISVMVRVKK